MKVANSQRLSFQLMSADDAELLFKLDQNPEVMRFINGGQPSSMHYILNEYIPRLEKFTDHQKGWGLWKVSLMTSQAFLGWILIRPMEFFTTNPELDNIEIGWRFLQHSWGQGYALEAATAVRDAMIVHNQKNGEITITKISAVAIEENIASIALMKKIGLKYVKTYRDEAPFEGLNAVYYQQEVSTSAINKNINES